LTFTELKIPGLWLIECDYFRDDRGFFARTWMEEEFRARGLATDISQCSLSFNHRRGTLRGIHYQTAPASQAKVVRAIRGAVFDVAVDLDPASPTFKQWQAVELTADNRRALYVPARCAHAYQSLTDDAEVLYFVSGPYSPGHERGVRWNDPAFRIEWPITPPPVINERDASFPDFSEPQ
jgi:dTDP-4-dehydrorhamnose 3,5-epimerase